MNKLKVMTILGTRPEIIRLSRVMDRLDRFADHVIVHTGQNWDYELNEVFFEDVALPGDALIGNEGEGWAQCTAELAFERSGPERIYSSVVLFDAWTAHLRHVGRADGATAALVGRLTSQVAVLRGRPPPFVVGGR